MSILIKGMEMPKAGQVIEIAQNVDGSMFARLEPSYGHWYEIVEVPTPHGQLIDEDKLRFEIEKYFNGLPIQGHYDMLKLVDEVPTIVEAEEGEDE